MKLTDGGSETVEAEKNRTPASATTEAVAAVRQYQQAGRRTQLFFILLDLVNVFDKFILKGPEARMYTAVKDKAVVIYRSASKVIRIDVVDSSKEPGQE